MHSPRSSQRCAVATYAALQLSGCACGVPVSNDAGTSMHDAAEAPDARAEDAASGGRDAWRPDAWVPSELTLDVLDSTPCPPLIAVPRRPRALPPDPAPRVLWRRNVNDVAEGYIVSNGAIGQDGHVHFSTVLFTQRHVELDRDGVLLGEGLPGGRGKGPMGPMSVLFDGRAAEWAQDTIRIDLRPPRPDTGAVISFPMPPSGFDEVELAATTDGLYAYRRSLRILRRYCDSRRLRWELRGLDAPAWFQVEDDDSVWLNGGAATDHQTVRVDRHGGVIERVPWPEGAARTDMAVLFAGNTRFLSVGSETRGDTTLVVAIDEASGAELSRIELPFDEVSGLHPDPLGGLWVGNGRTPGMTRYLDGIPVAHVEGHGLTRAIFGEDGSILTQGGTAESPTVVRILPDGTVGWELPVPTAAIGEILDDDGRLYLFGEDITVVQTDVLPPAVRGCWQTRCTPRADNRIGVLAQ